MYKITKLEICKNPVFSTANSIEEYRESVARSLFTISDDHLSPSVGYEVVGNIIQFPEVGKCVMMDRKFRNGVEVRGDFYTSRVTAVDGDMFTTQNSVYKIEKYEN
jgi:hypothetical protein